MSSILPRATVMGIGAVTPMGRHLAVIKAALSTADTSTREGMNHPLRVPDDLLVDAITATQLRRADRFTRMAVIAATDAWNTARKYCADIVPERIGLILSSGFGPHCRGFKFLDGILDAGDTAASPTDFSHSVHGAASAYISRMLGIRGPAINVTDFEIGFEETIQIAQCWLQEKSCDRVLIGAVEELGEVMLSCAGRMLEAEKKISPSEGAVFLMVGPNDKPGIAHIDAAANPTAVDLLIVEDAVHHYLPQMRSLFIAKQTVNYAGVFGHCASSVAFSVLGGLLAMPTIDTAATLRTSSEGRQFTLLLEK